MLGKHSGNATLLHDTTLDFNLYKKKYNWGSNIYYHFAANNGIHPTFVQTLLSDGRYSKQQILEIIKNIELDKLLPPWKSLVESIKLISILSFLIFISVIFFSEATSVSSYSKNSAFSSTTLQNDCEQL